MNLKTIVQIFIIILIITILFSFINIFFKENTIEQVYINEEKITDTKLEVAKGTTAIYQVGKRKFANITVA